MSALSQTVEDYLKAIYVLVERDGVAKTGALARHLGITAGSVTEMIKRMARMTPPLLVYRQHHGAHLTDPGKIGAMAVIRRHRLLETFLHQTLQLGWEAVHEEAETLEHHISERLLHAIDHHLDSPRFDPHGEPIPDASGQMRAPAGRALTAFDPGTAFRIVRVDPSITDMLEYLNNLGIGLATTGVLIDHAPFEGPVTLRLTDKKGSRETAIGKEVAGRIYGIAI